jgi:hypothetical protein
VRVSARIKLKRRFNPASLSKIAAISRDFLIAGFSLPIIKEHDLSEAKQARGVAAQNFFFIGTVELESGDDFNRPVVAHVEAVVAAHHHTVRTYKVDQVIKRFRGMADRVVGETSEITRWRLLQRLTFLPHLPTVVESADEIWKSAAGVGKANLKLRKSIQESAKNYVRCSDRRIERISQKVM